MEKHCDNCKHVDDKSSRYPCSECDEFIFDKWEDPNKEDFDHENRIYTLEGKFKASEEEFFQWKDEMESKYNHLSGKLTKIAEKLEDIRTMVNYNHEHGLPIGYYLRWIAPMEGKD